MARRVKDSTLDSREARGKLKARGRPYWRAVERGLHIGYRRLKGKAGTWCLRHYVGGQEYQVEGLGIADDLSDPDGATILSFWDAQAKARQKMAARAAGTGTTRTTVAHAVESYIAFRDERDAKRTGKAVRSDAGHRLRRYVLGQPARGEQPERASAPLASIRLQSLDDAHLREWCDDLPETLTTSSRKRLSNDLKAALNTAYAKHRKQLPPTLPDTIKYGLKIEDDEGEGQDVPDSQVLTDGQVTALLRAAREVDAEQGWDGDLYRLVAVMAATGARYSQVARLRVRDCQIANNRLIVPDSRKGRKKQVGSKPIPVPPGVIDVLRPVVFRRGKDEWLLERWRSRQVEGGRWERAGRGPWSKSELTRPWAAIRIRADMAEATPYCLRHSSIVRGIRANLPIRLVAAAHDTSVKIIERHYSRFIVGDLEKLLASAVVPLLPQDKGRQVLPMRRAARIA